MQRSKSLSPLPGPQTQFASTPADVAIYGGAAGGGKSYGLLLEPLRHIDLQDFSTVCFRRTIPQLRNPGGLWSESQKTYGGLNAEPKYTVMRWEFESGMSIKFAHLQHEKTVYDWQGSQIPLILFDELTHFSRTQFSYMLSRNRSTTGVPGYIRATTNPDADSWVKTLVQWWLDPATGYPIPERSGVIRYFITIQDQTYWADTAQELIEQFGPEERPKSFTFIPAKLSDNPILMEKDPNYLANLRALGRVERARLLDGNWNIRPTSGEVFQKHWFEIIEGIPADGTVVRYWDRAATEVSKKNRDPDYTVGLKMSRSNSGVFYVHDVVRLRGSPYVVEDAIKNTAKRDGLGCRIYLEQDPGSAGVAEAKNYARLLAGFDVRFNKPTQDKITRANPVSAQAEAGNVKILRADWNESFLNELQLFPDASHDDQVDALSGAFNMILLDASGEFGTSMEQEENLATAQDFDW